MKKLEKLFVLLLCSLAALPGFSQSDQVFQSDKLVKKWETPATLSVPESVCFDQDRNLLYVSNINGNPTDKDGNGFIAIISLEGRVLNPSWIAGLDAPKGMGIFNGVLYVTDIDRVAAIDIENEKIMQFYEFPEAKFLNDIAIDEKGAVYISDMKSTRIYRIFNGWAETWLDDPSITNPNGLFVEENVLMIGCKKIVRTDITDKKSTVWLENTGGIDGLEGTGDGRYLFSDWQGKIYLVGSDKKTEKILETTSAGINAADIEYIPAQNLILVPTFSDNRVMAYELK